MGQSVVIFVGRITGLVFATAVPLVLVRLLDQPSFGAYKQYFLVAATATLILAWGIPASLFYFLPGAGAGRGQWITSSLVLLSIPALAMVIALWVFGQALLAMMGLDELAAIAPVLGLYTALMMLTFFTEDLAVVEQRPILAAVTVFGAEVIRSTMYVVAVLIEASIESIAWASVAYASLRAAYVAWFAITQYGRDLLQLRWATVRHQLNYVLPFGVAILLGTMQTYLHQYVVAAKVSAAAFAIYAVGCFQVPGAHIAYTAIGDVGMVHISAAFKRGDTAAATSMYKSVVRALTLVFVPMFVFFAWFAEGIIEVLFTAQYLDAAPVLRVFALMLLGFPPADHSVLRARNETRFIFFANGAALMVSAASVLPLYGALGFPGAVLSYVLGVFAARALGVTRVAYLLRTPISHLIPFKTIGAAFALALLSALVADTAIGTVTGFVGLILVWVVFSGIYAGSAWVSGAIPIEYQDRLRAAARRLIAVARAWRISSIE